MDIPVGLPLKNVGPMAVWEEVRYDLYNMNWVDLYDLYVGINMSYMNG